MLIPFGYGEYGTVKASGIFLNEEKQGGEALRKSARCAKYDFAVQTVHRWTGACQKFSGAALQTILMYAITFHIFPWDADTKWARVKVILVKGDKGITRAVNRNRIWLRPSS